MSDAEVHELEDMLARGDGLQSADERLASPATQDYEQVHNKFDAGLARRIVRKLDLVLLPFLCLLFLLNSLDKSNIGNAETAGFTQDTGLEPDDLNTSMAFFFSFFVALQPIGAILGRTVGMSRFVPTCMAIWGACTIMHAFVKSKTQLILLRVTVAILEAGFYPTTVHFLSLYYTRYEFAFRTGLFYGQTTIAGAIGGFVSWLVFSLFPRDPARPQVLHSWQLLFIIEGCLTILVASVGFLWLPRDVATSWFLSSDERISAKARIDLDRAVSETRAFEVSRIPDHQHDEEDTHDSAHHRLLGWQTSTEGTTEIFKTTVKVDRYDILSAFLDWKIWHLLICNILSAIPATAFATFLPLVIRRISDADLPPATANLLAAPPFLCGAAAVLVFTRWSDAQRCRLFPVICGISLSCTGLFIAVVVPARPILLYIAICITFTGSFIASPLTVAWISDNADTGKRAVLLGINGWGNIAGASSAFLFTTSDAANGYTFSFAFTLVCGLASLCGYCLFFYLLRKQNSWRATLIAGWSDAEKEREILYGDGPWRCEIPEGWRRLVMSHFARERTGDERMTFQYTY